MPTIIFSNEEKEEMFYNAMCNALPYVTNGYSLQLDFNEAEYKEARAKLNSPCLEDVLMQLLRDGKTIKFIDLEADNEEHPITLQLIHDNMPKLPIRNALNIINEQDDAEDADVVIQTVIFGEVIFG